jgi:subtilisin family serine protease
MSVTSVGHKFPRGYIDPTYNNIKWEWKDCHEEVISDPNSAHHHNDAVDICAPGYCVPTTYATCESSGKYGNSWGTSFAAPQVASAIGLVLSVNPCLTAGQAMNLVKSSADAGIYSIPENANYIGLLGTGRLDVHAAVLAAAETATLYYTTPTNLTGTQVIKTNYAIRSLNQPVVITSGSNIKFMTRKEIELGTGFEVELGATFETNINVNNPVVCQ